MDTPDQHEALTPFHFDEDRPGFDDLAKDNGFTYWWARDLMQFLGYASWDSFFRAVQRAITATLQAKITIEENFRPEKRELNGRSVDDYKLSKFGCYMVAMNSDAKKPEVALAQAYFAAIAEAFQKHIASADDVERVEIRHQISEQDKSFSSVAHQRGVRDSKDFGWIKNQGYLGLYNMSLKDLRKRKGDPAPGNKTKTLLDYMGKRELAANLFRITETEARIKAEDLHGKQSLGSAAKTVGQEVRATMTRSGGTPPEDLPLETDIKKIETDLRKTEKKLKD